MEEEAAPGVRLVLGQAVIKGKGMEWLLQKAVELGVDEVQPLRTRHTVVKAGEDKPEKWRRLVLEACKQCGRKRLPVVREIVDFDRWVPSVESVRVIASLAGRPRPLRGVLDAVPKPQELALLIGPEGDFSAEETTLALAHGWMPAGLGDTVLRSETAAVFCAGAVRFYYA
jgi:16S rRNA (uracil1498-N3)-methyltransferase